MKILIKILLAMFVALFLWEIILSNTVFKVPGYTKDQSQGRIRKQGTVVHGSEGFSRTHTNSFGFRGPEINCKENDEYRILALGDSFTEALQVSDDETYTYLLEHNLRFKNITKVINGGSGGATPANYIYLANFYKATFTPDMVIIQLNEADFTREIISSEQDYVLKKENGSYKIHHNPEHLGVGAKLEKRFPYFIPLLDLSITRVGFDKIKDIARKGKNENYFPPISSEVDYSDIIDWSIKTIKEQYPNVVILYIPRVFYNDLSSSSPIDNSVELSAQKYSIPFINMRTPFVNHFTQTGQPSHGFNNTTPGVGHINKTGHSLVASELTHFFEQKVVLQ